MISATVTGNLGGAPEFKLINGSTPVLKFSVASNDREKVNGEWKDVASWVNVELYGKRAESLSKLGLTSKTKVAVRGALRLRKWESNGKTGVSADLRAEDVELMSAKPGTADAAATGGTRDDDEIPF